MRNIESIEEAEICIEDMVRQLEYIHEMQIEIQDDMAEIQEFLREMKEQ